jgi:N-hydroxyarylamine O-acetyltransferase
MGIIIQHGCKPGNRRHSLNLADYLKRLNFEGPVRPDLETLRALHLAHQLAVPFENLDVQLRRPVSFDIAAAYEKIVTRRRGGWCFELNGLMGWALTEIGFDVVRMSAGVMRARDGDFVLGNHLCLMVRLDQPYLVDVGFGGSLVAPLPLRVSEREDPPYRLGLSRIDDDYWRFTEVTHASDPFTFDFRALPADETRLAHKCHFLQTDPGSSFVKSLVVQRRRRDDAHLSLRGRVLKTIHSAHTDKILLDSAEALVETLRQNFDLDVPEARTLWPAICARHEELFSAGPGST